MKFETAKDFARQDRATRLFCNEYDYSYASSEEWAKIDYQIFGVNAEVICGFEVKGCKNQKIGDKETVLVSMRKIVDGQQFQKQNNVPVVMCWSFDDGILFTRLNKLNGEFRLGGRKPRAGSTFDEEMLVYIKQNKLKKLLF
tara:strand:- start:920 stop:1345 length:426 start_codon:yes stop_codon:yes gene_type:complete